MLICTTATTRPSALLLILIASLWRIVTTSCIADDVLATALSGASLVHEIVENVIVFNCKNVHHVLEFQMLLVHGK